jgi:paraquat-inducible protein B
MSSRVRIHPAAIGAFAAGAVALAIAGAFVFGAAGKLFVRKFPVVMFFDDDVNGLAVGAQVAYRGIKLGQVTKIHSVVGSPRIAVLASLERGPFVSRDDLSGGNMDQLRKNLEEAIAQGLRAQLALQSLLTGQLYVNLVLRPETPASFAKLEPGMLEIPTIPTIMAQLEAGLQQVPLAKVPKHLYDTLEGSAKLLQSQDLAKALESVGPLVADAQTLLRRVDKEAVPLLVSLRATSDTARSSLVDITQRLDRVVTDLQIDASRLMTSLTDTSNTARGTVKDVGGTVKDVGSDLQKTLAQLTPEIAKLAAKLQEASDTLRATLEKTDTTLRGVDGTLAGDSPVGHELTQALKEVAAAAQSLQTLAEYLERHPESLLTGKPRARPVR